MNGKPTIVLVHGAFADASGWAAVIRRLHDADYTAYAPANPLRGVAFDADYIRSFLRTIDGPIVLVGHSYGGFVITNAAVGADNVRALVYVAGFAPDEGETAAQATGLGGDEVDLTQVVLVRPFPGAGEGDGDAYLKPEIYPQAFCPDLPPEEGAVMAVSQRPAALATLVAPSGPPAWKSLPSWFVVATEDRIIPPSAERVMAARAGSTTIEVDSSHVVFMSHPDEVTTLILDAAGSVT
jgi:pimeloyl-ACP methyl ester carboxylesterase